MPDELFGLRVVHSHECARVPQNLPAAAVGHIAQQDRLGQRAGIIEFAGCCSPGFDRLDPFLMMFFIAVIVAFSLRFGGRGKILFRQ